MGLQIMHRIIRLLKWSISVGTLNLCGKTALHSVKTCLYKSEVHTWPNSVNMTQSRSFNYSMNNGPWQRAQTFRNMPTILKRIYKGRPFSWKLLLKIQTVWVYCNATQTGTLLLLYWDRSRGVQLHSFCIPGPSKL